MGAQELDLCAAVLAGGQSRRFGSDKALAILDGQSLLSHVAASLENCPERLIVSPPGRYVLSGWQQLPDTRPGEGPLAGLEAALMAAQREWVALCAVDLPGLNPAYWRLLAARRTDSGQCVLGQSADGATQVLAALYHRSALPLATALLNSGERRLRALEAMLSSVTLPWDEVQTVAPAAYLNANTPQDLEKLRR